MGRFAVMSPRHGLRLDLGEKVLVSCITSCGRCRFCREGHYGLCSGGGGWIFGHLIDGLQAEYARVPFADTSVHKVPETLTDEQVLFGNEGRSRRPSLHLAAGGQRFESGSSTKRRPWKQGLLFECSGPGLSGRGRSR